MKAIALGYHDVIAAADIQHSPLPNTRLRYALDLDNFRAHLDSILKRTSRIALADDRGDWGALPIFLTFDDGAECALSIIADELEERTWRGQFLITTNWIGRTGFLSKLQIRQLHERGHGIGSHSCSHPPRMSKLSTDDLRSEWEESCAVLEDIVGDSIHTASVPDGYYSERVAGAASDAGIRTLFTSEPTMSCFGVNGCLVIGRYFLKRHSSAQFAGELIARNPWPRRKMAIAWQLKKPVKFVAGAAYLKMRRLVLARQTSAQNSNPSPRPTLHNS
jgi:peptidoglycan/xylan/chitin deacetylase (PgdA/CDA1 family)